MNELKVDSDNIITNNPFPGLRAFRPDESDLFFGRDSQIDLVINQLVEKKFIAIVGASGVGKSSFMSCGVLSHLIKEDEQQDTWQVLSMTPGSNPIRSLASAIIDSFDSEDLPKNVDDLEKEILDAPDVFPEMVKKQAEEKKHKYLFFIDQFEEVFRFSSDDEAGNQSATTLIDLIVSVISDSKLPIFIVVAIRADFIGDCARFPMLTKIINNSQYLIPQLTKEEKRDTIKGPVKFKGAKISDRLVDTILDEMGESSDQLPIMQHAMMRTWSQWEEYKTSGEEITADDYHAIGGMKSALSDHAREAYKELSRSEQQLCERIFKTLTEKGEEGRGVRRPTKLKDICAITDSDKEKVVKIVDFFRSPSRSLLLPSLNVELDDDTVIDISHESLMRNWVELSEWVDEEAESVKLYLRLSEAASMHQEGKAGLWVPPDLLLAQDWQKKQKPTLAWGLLHDKAYENTMIFLDHSKTEYERSQVNKEKIQKRRLTVFRWIAAVMFVLMLAAGWSWITARQSAIVADQARHKAEEKEKQAIIAESKAVESAEVAEQQRVRALLSAQIAKEQEAKARAAKIEADSNAVEARRQEQLAIEKQKEATELRLLSIAKSMAIKSKEIDNDSSMKKALIARQAYNFYSAIDGSNGKTKKLEKDPDIYNGLYYALKAINKDDIFSISKHEQNVRSIISSSNSNTVFTTGSDGNIIKWVDREFHDYIKKSERGTRINKSLALNKGEKRLACSGNFNFIEIYNVQGIVGLVNVIPTEWTDTWHLAYTANNDLVCIGSNNQIMLYKDKEFIPISNKGEKINTISVHPTKDYVIAGLNNGQVVQYHLESKKSEVVLSSNSPIYSVEYSKDGSYLAIGDEKGKVFLIEDNKVIQLPGHSARVNQITFNHDNSFLATGSFDKTVRLWNIRSKDDAPIIFDDHQDWVWSIMFTYDDNQLWAGSRDYLIRTWPTDLTDMAEQICPQLNRKKLNQEEWVHYAGEDFSNVVESTCN